MPLKQRRPSPIRESTDLELVRQGEEGSYSYRSPKRSRKIDAVADDDAPYEELRITREFVPTDVRARGTQDIEAPRHRRHDPDLCSCEKMLGALRSKLVMVVCDGPVTLAPAVLREETLFKGGFSLDRIERPYDGMLWAFRHCPFEGCLIDPDVEIRPQVENMTCCGTMTMAVEHGRVELPHPTRVDRVMARFTNAGDVSVLFSRCPWCATEMIDLVIARHKRHHGL